MRTKIIVEHATVEDLKSSEFWRLAIKLMWPDEPQPVEVISISKVEDDEDDE